MARVERVFKHPTAAVHDGAADFNISPQRAKANLYHTHFRNDDEGACSRNAALGAFRQFIGAGGDGVDPVELFGTLLTYERQIQAQRAKEARKLHALQEQAEYEAYLAEVKRLKVRRPTPACFRRPASIRAATTSTAIPSLSGQPSPSCRTPSSRARRTPSA